MVETPYLIELMRRMHLDDPTASIEISNNGAADVRWHDPRVNHMLTLLVTERTSRRR